MDLHSMLQQHRFDFIIRFVLAKTIPTSSGGEKKKKEQLHRIKKTARLVLHVLHQPHLNIRPREIRDLKGVSWKLFYLWEIHDASQGAIKHGPCDARVCSICAEIAWDSLCELAQRKLKGRQREAFTRTTFNRRCSQSVPTKQPLDSPLDSPIEQIEKMYRMLSIGYKIIASKKCTDQRKSKISEILGDEISSTQKVAKLLPPRFTGHSPIVIETILSRKAKKSYVQFVSVTDFTILQIYLCATDLVEQKYISTQTQGVFNLSALAAAFKNVHQHCVASFTAKKVKKDEKHLMFRSRTTHVETKTQARFLEYATLPRSSRCRGILLSKGPLFYPERQSPYLGRFFKGEVSEQRLAPRSHVDTLAPYKRSVSWHETIQSAMMPQSVSSGLDAETPLPNSRNNYIQSAINPQPASSSLDAETPRTHLPDSHWLVNASRDTLTNNIRTLVTIISSEVSKYQIVILKDHDESQKYKTQPPVSPRQRRSCDLCNGNVSLSTTENRLKESLSVTEPKGIKELIHFLRQSNLCDKLLFKLWNNEETLKNLFAKVKDPFVQKELPRAVHFNPWCVKILKNCFED
ncbi:hypothetical protein WN51_12731 [Melipona quadrifasciata]|uniref:Uncharacterized protein n=1 Tax=Melipona quadrifasciata TaxID=166423 RepID=A0A0M9A2E2_9HYME|nr:hypothetical protein WN51_12731 [Melipona quadrifasciata]